MENYEVISFGDIPMSAFNSSDESSDSIEHFECFGDVPIDVLMHHGIKGQRWGVRRYQNKDGSLTKAGRKRYAKLEAELEKLGGKKSDVDTDVNKKSSESNEPKKKISDMTDDEIRERTNRLTLEKNLRQAEKDWDSVMQTPVDKVDKKKSHKGREMVVDMLEKGAKNIGGQLVTYVMGIGVNKALGKLFGDDAIVNPKKGQKDK